MIAKLAELNQAGIETFRAFLERNKETPSAEEPPYHLLSSAEYTSPVPLAVGDANVETDVISDTRMQLAERVNYLISSRAELASVCESKGIGAWLSLALFSSICKKDDDGNWKVGQMTRYIDDGKGDQWGFAIHRRNIVCGALAIYHLHGENARLSLHGAASSVSDYAEVIGAIEDIMLNPVMIEVLDRLYWDAENNRPKTGLRGQSPYVNGSYRRFVNKTYGFYAQHYMTYDFWTMTADQIIALLPEEYQHLLE
jgi:hypothetical protein